MNRTISQSRTYVAICVREDGGHFFVKFILPEVFGNDSNNASWYYLNTLDRQAFLVGVITIEDYKDFRTQVQLEALEHYKEKKGEKIS